MRNSLSLTKVGSLWNKWRVCWIREPSKDKEDNAEKLNYFLCTDDVCEVAKSEKFDGWNRMTKFTRQWCCSAYSLNDLKIGWEERDGEPSSTIISSKNSLQNDSFTTTVMHSKTWRYNLGYKKSI